jgi:hypothetical protein
VGGRMWWRRYLEQKGQRWSFNVQSASTTILACSLHVMIISAGSEGRDAARTDVDVAAEGGKRAPTPAAAIAGRAAGAAGRLRSRHASRAGSRRRYLRHHALGAESDGVQKAPQAGSSRPLTFWACPSPYLPVLHLRFSCARPTQDPLDTRDHPRSSLHLHAVKWESRTAPGPSGSRLCHLWPQTTPSTRGAGRSGRARRRPRPRRLVRCIRLRDADGGLTRHRPGVCALCACAAGAGR